MCTLSPSFKTSQKQSVKRLTVLTILAFLAILSILTDINLILVPVSSVLTVSAQVLQSPRVTNWGKWGKWHECPDKMVVTAVVCLVEDRQGRGVSNGRDDSALNGVALRCSYPDFTTPSSLQKEWVYSSLGTRGYWRKVEACPRGTYAYGFALRSEESQGSDEKDDTAANDIKLFCRHPWSHGQTSETLWGHGSSWGDWSAPQFCPYGRGICGIRTQVEPRIFGKGNVDNTALNNVDMKCCPNSKIRCLSCKNGK